MTIGSIFSALLFIIVSIVAIIFAFLAIGLSFSLMREQRQKVQEVFIKTTQKHQHSSFPFDPHSAVLLYEDESRGRYTGVSLVYRIYRSNESEYFLYIGTPDKCQTFTHLTKERAKGALSVTRKIFKKEFPNG
jgi:hypothetical protein